MFRRFLRSVISAFHHFGKRVSRSSFKRFLHPQIGSVKTGILLNIGCGNKIYQSFTLAKEIRLDLFFYSTLHIRSDAHILPFMNDLFEGVLMEEVLEHCHDPRDVIDEVFRTLKPGGRLILTVPFLFPIHDEPHDYYRFTEFGLQHLLRRFSICSVTARQSGYASCVVLFERLIKEKPWTYFAPIIVIMAYFALLLDPLMSRILRLKTYVSGYFVLAVK